MTIKIFVEGGGGGPGSADLQAQCREGFRGLLMKAGLTYQPRIVACGGRRAAFDDYCTALRNDEPAMLLVDSEDAVTVGQENPWGHVASRKGDAWPRPDGAQDDDLHFMVRCTESWLLADVATLGVYFGKNFKGNKLPKRPVSDVDRHEAEKALQQASKDTRKGAYAKGKHSFALLRLVDIALVRKEPWADRFFRVAAQRSKK